MPGRAPEPAARDVPGSALCLWMPHFAHRPKGLSSLIYPLPFDSVDLARYGETIDVSNPDAAARSLARAVGCSPGWERFTGCSLLVRTAPAALAIVGRLTEDQRRELAKQADALRGRFSSFRYVSYAQAELDAARLAHQITPWLADPEWSGCHFVAVPRGGHLVLGMLATLLDLPRERLRHPPDSGTPVVVVDDCALSGTRFREQLAILRTERVAFAHLYSTPALRAAVLAAEPRVHHCVAAVDLAELPYNIPDGPSPWTNLSRRGYWLGRAEFVTFAWGEPDRVLENANGDALLPGWKLLPPELCLKHRRLPALPIVQQDPGCTPLRPGPEVFFAEIGDDLVVAARRGGLVHLTGVAADTWRLIVATGSRMETYAALVEHYEVDGTELARDLERLIDELLSLGLLVDE